MPLLECGLEEMHQNTAFYQVGTQRLPSVLKEKCPRTMVFNSLRQSRVCREVTILLSQQWKAQGPLWSMHWQRRWSMLKSNYNVRLNFWFPPCFGFLTVAKVSHIWFGVWLVTMVRSADRCSGWLWRWCYAHLSGLWWLCTTASNSSAWHRRPWHYALPHQGFTTLQLLFVKCYYCELQLCAAHCPSSLYSDSNAVTVAQGTAWSMYSIISPVRAPGL